MANASEDDELSVNFIEYKFLVRKDFVQFFIGSLNFYCDINYGHRQ